MCHFGLEAMAIYSIEASGQGEHRKRAHPGDAVIGGQVNGDCAATTALVISDTPRNDRLIRDYRCLIRCCRSRARMSAPSPFHQQGVCSMLQ